MKRLLLLPAAFSMLAGSACGASRGTEVSVGARAPAVAGTYFSSGDAAPSPTRVSLTEQLAAHRHQRRCDRRTGARWNDLLPSLGAERRGGYK